MTDPGVVGEQVQCSGIEHPPPGWLLCTQGARQASSTMLVNAEALKVSSLSGGFVMSGVLNVVSGLAAKHSRRHHDSCVAPKRMMAGKSADSVRARTCWMDRRCVAARITTRLLSTV